MNTCLLRLSSSSAFRISHRGLSVESESLKNLRIVKKPSDDHIQQFEKLVGGFNDIRLLKETMNDRYQLYLLCDKNDRVISGTHSILYKSLNPSLPDFRTFGLSYQPPDSFHLLPHLMSQMVSDLDAVNMNSGGCVESKTSAVWRKILHTKVRGATYYVSDYSRDEVFDPELEFEGLVVKKFSEVPPEDVTKYDNSIFPYHRNQFLLSKFSRGLGRVVYDSTGKVTGIGLVSMESGLLEIGPMYADNKTAAQAMFQCILKELNGDFERIRVRCTDKFEDSATWIRPFLSRRHEMTPFAHLKFNRVIPDGIQFGKVFVDSNPTNSPC
uniref:DUF1248 domain-containing protein n=1 Tax=Caenorhabditis tropicalis TaxID=1561998 RepID=A0A1I7V140_9PELO